MPVDKYRSRRRDSPRRRSRSPQRRRSRSPRKDSRAKSPRRYRSRSRQKSPRNDRKQSPSPKRYRSRSKSPDRSKRQPSPARRDSRRSTSQSKRGSRYSRSKSRSPVKSSRSEDVKHKKGATNKHTPSPTTLDDVLMNERPLSSSKHKGSIYDRYDKYDINVMSIHNGGKDKRSRRDVDNDGSAKDFSPTDVIELVHELNPKGSSKKKSRPIFDREEIKNFVEEKVETKVIRIMPSDADMKKLEAKLSKDKPSRHRSREESSKQEKKSSKDSKSLLRREPEKKRYEVTDDDLLEEARDSPKPSHHTSRLESSKPSGGKRSVQDRLGNSERDDTHRRIEERLGRTPEQPSRRDREPIIRSTDLRHSLSSRLGRDSEYNEAPLVRDYGHKSLRTDSALEREKTPDFSKRPDKHKVDMMEIDPTFVPRGGRYDQHDDRDDFSRSEPWDDPRGGFRPRGAMRGGSRGGFRGRPRGGLRGGFRGERDSRRFDSRRDEYRNPRPNRKSGFAVETWKHDKFDELENENELERKAEPSSTTA